MPSSHVERPIDSCGRVCVPREMMNRLKLGPGSKLIFSESSGAIVMRPVELACALCGNGEDLREILHGQRVCGLCVADLLRAPA